MKIDSAKTLRVFLFELAIYAVLVVTYFFFVLHYLGDWLHELALHHHYYYAGLAIVLIVGQAVMLEALTTFLLKLIGGRSE